MLDDILLRQSLAKIGNRDYLAAESLLLEHLKEHPDSFLAYKTLGTTQFALRKFHAAVAAYSQATSLEPQDVDSWMGQGSAFRKVGDLEEAAAAFGEAIVLKPDDLACIYNLAVTCTALGRTEQGDRLLTRGITLYPDAANLHDALAQIHMTRGDREAAINSATRSIQLDSNRTAAYLKLAELSPTHELLNPDLLEKYLLRQSSSTADKRNVGFALGRVFHAKREFARAFDAYEAGNDAHAEIVDSAVGRYDRRRHERNVGEIIDLYSHNSISGLADSGSSDNRSIFVVGMTRSGTTLVEQILSRHPDVYCAGESEALARTRKAFEQLAVRADGSLVSTLPGLLVSKLRSTYLNALPIAANGRCRIVDKNPHNFFMLGLIAALFPRATIIHCRRDPVDTCLANYFQIYSPRHNYNNRLQDIGHYYNQYIRIMNHWRSLDIPNLLELRYEQLVSNTELVIRSLLAHCELPWRDECLSFYESDRIVLTPSQLQVRKQIYSTSVGNSANYAKHLGPLLDGPDAVASYEY